MQEKSCKEIGKEIKQTLGQLKGVKLSVTTEYDHISVELLQAPWPAFTTSEKHAQINPYYYKEWDQLTMEAKVFFQMVDEIINKYYYDNSDPMTDYFDCAFYYGYGVGKWDKDFKIVN
jgi:hypothetical protein